MKTELTTPYEGYPALALGLGGWGAWITTIVLVLLLQKSASKWIYLGRFAIVAGLGLTSKYVSVPIALGAFGTIILLGGLLWLIVLDKTKSLQEVRNK